MHKLALRAMDPTQTAPTATVQAGPGNAAVISLAGDWSLAGPLPDATAVAGEVGRQGSVRQVTVEASKLGSWDSVLPAFLFELAAMLRDKGAELTADGAPEGLRRLLAIAQAVPPRAGTAAVARPNPIARIGLAVQRWWSGVVDGVNFIGEVVLALLAFMRGRAKFRVEDVARVFAAAGPQALPIVTLIGLLAGLHPGLRRRQRAPAVRGPDLRRQPGHDRDGAGNGSAHGGGDHGGPDRRRVRGRAGHDAGQPGDRRAAHTCGRPECSTWSCRGCSPDDDATAARLLRDAHGNPGRRHRRGPRLRYRSAGIYAADAR